MASLTLRPGGYYLRDRLMKFDETVGKMIPKDVWMRLGTMSHMTAQKRLQDYLKRKPRSEALRVDLRMRDLVGLTRERKMTSGRCYYRADQYYLNFVEERFGDLFIGDLTTDVLRTWRQELEGRGLAMATMSKYFRGLRAMIRWAIKTGRYCGTSPFDGFVIPSEGRPRDIIAEVDQQRALMKACHDLRTGDVRLGQRMNALDPVLLADIIEITLTHGLRLGEVIGVNMAVGRNQSGRLRYEKDKGIRVRDLNPAGDVLYLQRTKLKFESNMGVNVTAIPLTARTREILARRRKGRGEDDLLFTHPNGKPVFSIYKAFRAFVERFGLIGLDGLQRPALRLQFRDLRKTAAVNMLASGVNTFVTAKLMGHTTSKTTEAVYLTRLNPETLTDARDRVEARLEAAWSRPEPQDNRDIPF